MKSIVIAAIAFTIIGAYFISWWDARHY